MAKLKRLSPELSKLVAQVVHQRHQARAVQETAEIRAVLAELIRRGRKPEDLFAIVLAGDMTATARESAVTTTLTTSNVR